jgi:disulfide bond formation protein DsbB
VSNVPKNPVTRVLLGLISVVLIAILGFGIYLASVAGELPWQEDPTRIPVEQFEGIPGFSPPTLVPTATAAASGTPVP